MRGRRSSLILALGLGAVLAGCGQQPGPISSGANTGSGQHLPFNSNPGRSEASPTRSFASIAIPAGTSFVIRLQAPLSSVVARAGDLFEATLDEPILVHEQLLAPRGAPLTGRVMAARPFGPDGPGYLRLTLSSLVLDRKTLELHTSSIFAKGSNHANPKGTNGAVPDNPAQFAGVTSANRNDVKFSTGRRLTFHLIDSLSLHE